MGVASAATATAEWNASTALSLSLSLSLFLSSISPRHSYGTLTHLAAGEAAHGDDHRAWGRKERDEETTRSKK